MRVLGVDELGPGQSVQVEVEGQTLALFNVGGEFRALGNRCAHRGGPLGQGLLDGHTVLCPWHSWGYDTRTGACEVNSEFDVPTNVLHPASKPDWAVIPGPNVTTRIYGPPPAEMPPATCIVCVIGGP